MSATTSAITLWLFVINLGVAFGAGLYEHRIVVPRRITPQAPGRWNAEAALLDDTGRRFWAFVTTVPLTLLTVANLLVAWQAAGTAQRLVARGWFAAALADRVFTFSYFIPTMIGLMGKASSGESVAVATRWWSLNYLRHLIVLTAWLASLKAFALFYQQCG